jgi:hypothetical protein
LINTLTEEELYKKYSSKTKHRLSKKAAVKENKLRLRHKIAVAILVAEMTQETNE